MPPKLFEFQERLVGKIPSFWIVLRGTRVESGNITTQELLQTREALKQALLKVDFLLEKTKSY